MAQLIKKLKDRELERIDVVSRETRIGRDESNDVAIDNPGISRHHASVLFDGQEFSVSDRGSQNGLYVNGQLTTNWRLREGDAIQVGKFELVFSLRGGVAHHELLQREATSGKVRNPLQTVALKPEDIQRYMTDAATRSKGPATTPPPAARPTYERPAPAADANPYKTLSIVLGLLVLSLGGVAAWLLFR